MIFTHLTLTLAHVITKIPHSFLGMYVCTCSITDVTEVIIHTVAEVILEDWIHIINGLNIIHVTA